MATVSFHAALYCRRAGSCDPEFNVVGFTTMDTKGHKENP